jgi:hypothetical protein
MGGFNGMDWVASMPRNTQNDSKGKEATRSTVASRKQKGMSEDEALKAFRHLVALFTRRKLADKSTQIKTHFNQWV